MSPILHARTLLGSALLAMALFGAAACQTAQPPPVAAPDRASVVQPPTRSVSCPLTHSSDDDEDFEPAELNGSDLDVTAFVAAVDALSGNGRVDITTEEDGRPAFRSVGVWELQGTLDAESDPVIAVEASKQVGVSGPTSATTSTAAADGASAAGAGNDPLLGQQWSNQRVPYSPTWVCSSGGGTDIAVVDTGVDITHPDLATKSTSGGSSLGGQGWVTAGGGGVDPHGHGTHVAGIAAATAGNGVGIAGVAPNARIIPVRVLDSGGSGYNIDVAAGITWATDNGAEVINLSLGSPYYSAAVGNAIAYATSRGVVVVAAAGNGGPGGAREYPGADVRSIGVGSVDEDLGVSGFSTHGDYVDVAAPGGVILSTFPGGGYAHLSGTSMATPFVSGVVALMRDTHPSLTAAQVKARLTATAIDAGTPGRDSAYGAGIIDPIGAVGN